MVQDGNLEEQKSLHGQKVSIFEEIPTEYGTVKGFTETEVIVRISAKEVRKINPMKTEIALQMFQHDHDLMYDSGMDLSTSLSEDLAKSNSERFNKTPEAPSTESDPVGQVEEEVSLEEKPEPPKEKKPKKPSPPKKFSLNLNEPEKEEPPKKEKPKKKHFSFVKQKVGA